MTAIITRIGEWLASWLLTSLFKGIKQWLDERALRKQREGEIKDALKPYLDSKTPEEQENAFQELLKHMRD